MQIANGFIVVKDFDQKSATLIKLSSIEKVICFKERIFIYTHQEESVCICDIESQMGTSYQQIMEALGLGHLV
jgi:hypothetical protein